MWLGGFSWSWWLILNISAIWWKKGGGVINISQSPSLPKVTMTSLYNLADCMVA